ncbi:MAG: ABC transporter ATP-binding protein/permease [Candidatus Aminicenantes bacterium]|nr:ABC transporter ATP-binding protein/permease [Candidatus Aminicenantes bacterium]
MNKKNFDPKVFSSIWKIASLIWRVKPLQASLLCLLIIIEGIFPAVNLWIGKLIVDSVVQGIGQGSEAFYKVIYYLVILLLVQLLSNIISYAGAAIQTLLGDIVAHKIDVRVIEKSTSLDLFYYDDSRFYDKLSRAQREATSRPLTIISTLFKLIQNSITITSMIFVLLRLHWGAVALLVFVAVPQLFMQAKYAKKGYSLLFSQTQDSRKLFYLSYILTSISHFKEIKLFNLGSYLIERYKKVFQKTFNENKKLVLKKNLGAFLVSFLSVVSYVVVYAYAIYVTINRDITLGDLTLYAGAFSRGQGVINSIISNLASLYENNLFIKNLFTFLDLEPRIAAPAMPLLLPERIEHGIEFRNVSFKYPGAGKWVLKDLNLKIQPDENIAIVGENGAGKTTIVKLLSRMYDPQEGEILLDGVDIKEFDPSRYQEMIGVIFQDFSQFQLTARENVGLGNIVEINNLDRIKKAAAKSGADHVIGRLPRGYESVLGKYFDEGSELSIGEWQKIAIARAFMRDSKILILDEPTASLDARTEYEIFQQFQELCRDKISLLVSHRFSTVRMADSIVVLEAGRIVEEGSHDELMRLGQKYAAMFNMQAEFYQESVNVEFSPGNFCAGIENETTKIK